MYLEQRVIELTEHLAVQTKYSMNR